MADERFGCIAIIQWIWTQVKRPFSYMLDNSPDSRVSVEMDASVPPSDSHASSSGYIASSSTATPARRYKYDVFLSFRGVDTRKGITVDIRDRLQSRGIKTFMDDKGLQVGDPISPTLMEAIERSKIREVSKKLSLSMKPRADTNRRLDKWRAALKKVADYSAWTTDAFKTHRELIDDVVQTFCKMVAPNANGFSVDFQPYEETIKAMDEVNDALRNEEVTVVGVYGMPGVGKTTMVTHLAVQACRNETFNRWIMATVSRPHNIDNIKRIQGILSGFLGVKLDDKLDVIVRAAKLHEEIMRREKLLIILDDIWDYIDLSEIGIPNFDELHNCSSKVVMTTRICHVCYVMDCQRNIILKSLSEQDSWTLFKRKTKRYFDSTFEGVARKVAKECGGLPIALITVAMALGDKSLHEWKRAAQRLENSQHANPNDDGKASECIRLSYDHLKDEYKPFFLLCCLFPEDHEIEIEDLFMYAMGKQLFRDVDTLEQARMDAKIWAGHLQDSCLLLGRDGEDIKMHDVVRDAAIQISRFLVKAAISLMYNDISKLPENLVCPPNLQILLLNENDCIKEIPETFFQSPNDLRVLDLAETSGLSLLPQSISLLTNLTFLSLLNCEDLPNETSILGNLKKLEILYLSNPPFEELSVELGGLTNLRIFNVSFDDDHYDDDRIRRIPPGVISEWKILEEVHLKIFDRWCKVEGDEEETIHAGFEEVTSLPKLRVLKATVFDLKALPKYVNPVPEWVEFDITIGNIDISSSYSRSIKLVLDNISDLPNWFRDGLMKRAEFLYWKGCQNLSDIFVELQHKGLLELRLLYMEREWYYDEIEPNTENETEESFTEDEIKQTSVDEIGESFSHDESHRNPLRIPVLQNLEEFILIGLDWEKSLEAVQTLPPGSLLNLKKLYLRRCYTDGDALISLAKLQILSNLEKIHIVFTSNIYIFRHDELFVSLQLNIRRIELSYCSMIGICEGRAPPSMFQNLQTLGIVYCDMLKGSLFTHEVAQCLPHLDYLELNKCTLLERIVEAGNNKTILPKLRDLYLMRCPLLYCESGSLDIECPSLELFHLSNCPKFAASFDDFNSRKQENPYRL